MTFLITADEVASVLDMKLALKTVEHAFKAFGEGNVQLPPKSYLQFDKGDLRSMPAYIHTKDMNIAGIKSVNVHPQNKKLPTVMATVVLTDPKNGYNLAILDGTYLTDMRTGAAGGVAAKYLSRRESKVAAFIGAGAQARTQLDALMQVRDLEEIRVASRSPASREHFCRDALDTYPDLTCIACDPREACKGADIVTTVTPVRKPIVKKSWIEPGTHINGIGADAAGKQELHTDLTRSCKIVIDEWQQASHSGEINVPIAKGKLSKKDVYAELAKIVAGRKKGRTNNKEITLFDSTGLAIQDVSTAYVSYKALKKRKLREVRFF